MSEWWWNITTNGELPSWSMIAHRAQYPLVVNNTVRDLWPTPLPMLDLDDLFYYNTGDDNLTGKPVPFKMMRRWLKLNRHLQEMADDSNLVMDSAEL